MEYLITQNKLSNLIFDYLDMKLNGVEKRKGVSTDIIFIFPNETCGMLGWNKSKFLYVHQELTDEIKNMFGLESRDALDVIGRYVEDRYNLEVKDTCVMLRHSFAFVENTYNLEVKNTDVAFAL